MPPVFTSFADAWRWFSDGGELEPLAERRERFTAGRAQFLSFEVAVSETTIGDAAVALQDELADIDALDLVPRELLHISVRGVGFQVIARARRDDVLREEVPAIASRAAAIISRHAPTAMSAGPINVFPDAVILEVHEGGGLGELRARLSADEREDAFGHAAEQYLPHVTIAAFRDTSAARALRERLPALREVAPVEATIRRIELARWWFTGVDMSEDPERDVVRSYLLAG